MFSPPFLENEHQRLALLEEVAPAPFVPSYVLREERFDRISRIALRLLDVPVALISVLDGDMHWVRSAQGLSMSDTPASLSFAGHVIKEKHFMRVPDASEESRFMDNPLVSGPNQMRSCLGVTLNLAPGIAAGTLCVMDARVRNFSCQDVAALRDLGHLAEAEFRLDALLNVQKRLLIKLDLLERRARVDPQTGCWNVRGFRELVAMAVTDAARDGSTLALCYVRVRNFDALAKQHDKGQLDAMRQLTAQVLRKRLPDNGALAALGGGDFCALIPAPTPLAIEDRLGEFTYPRVKLNGPGMRFDLDLQLGFGLALWHEMPAGTTATEIWATALAKLVET
ncbi:MAG: GAF domain-containing protein [Bdellovibrionales bacterium]|nr:GAF domain-containing protein [Ramlibacter sp.]